MHSIEGNNIIIELDLNSKKLSSTGKTILLATSNGYQNATLKDGTEIGISYNVTKKVSK